MKFWINNLNKTTPLHCAIKEHQIDIAKLLLQCKSIDINAIDSIYWNQFLWRFYSFSYVKNLLIMHQMNKLGTY